MMQLIDCTPKQMRMAADKIGDDLRGQMAKAPAGPATPPAVLGVFAKGLHTMAEYLEDDKNGADLDKLDKLADYMAAYCTMQASIVPDFHKLVKRCKGAGN